MNMSIEIDGAVEQTGVYGLHQTKLQVVWL